MADTKVEVSVELIDKISKQLANIEKSAEGVEKGLTSAFSRSSQVFNSFVGNLAANVATKALEEIFQAGKQLFDLFIVQGIKAAEETQSAISQLNTALALNGDFTSKASAQMQKFADDLSEVSTVDDEVILKQLALAKTFGATNEQAEKLVKAAVNLSAATGKDLDSAVDALGKTLSGVGTGIGKMVPSLKGLSDESLRSGKAIDAVLQKFGGAALAQTKTFAGGIEQLKNNFNNLQSEIGKSVVQNPVVIALFGEINKVITSLKKSLEENSAGFRDFVGSGVVLAIQAMQLFLSVLDFTGRLGVATFNVIKLGILEIAKPILAVGGLLSQNMKLAFEVVAEDSKKAATAVQESFSGETFIGQINGGLEKLEEATKAAFENIAVNKDEQAALDIQREVDKGAILAEIEAEKQREADARAEEVVKKLSERNERLAKLNSTSAQKEITENEAKIRKILDSEKISAVQRELIEKDLADKKLALRLKDAETAATIFGNLASLSKTGNKTLFEIGKAAAIASATINAGVAITRALAEGGPFLGPILAASIAVKTGVEIANIAATTLQRGIDEVPGSGTRDNFPAILAPGERVVPAKTNEDLTSFLQGAAGLNEGLAAIANRLDRLQNQTVVNVGNREIINVINESIRGGRQLATS